MHYRQILIIMFDNSFRQPKVIQGGQGLDGANFLTNSPFVLGGPFISNKLCDKLVLEGRFYCTRGSIYIREGPFISNNLVPGGPILSIIMDPRKKFKGLYFYRDSPLSKPKEYRVPGPSTISAVLQYNLRLLMQDLVNANDVLHCFAN